MQNFLEMLIGNWWGVLILVVLGLAIILVLSVICYKQFFKRFYDFVFSLLAIIFLSPTLITLLIVGRIKMKGSPIFFQYRPGIINKKTGKEKIFKLRKFRSMTNERDEDGNLLPDEKRLTKYGKFLRATSLDELPELFNILKGDMSFIGPRPQLIKDMVFMSENQRERHTIRPGLTGLAQVNGRNVINWETKFQYDLDYVQKISLIQDVKIAFKTLKTVFMRANICRPGTESDTDFGDVLLQQHRITDEEYKAKQYEAKLYLEKRGMV